MNYQFTVGARTHHVQLEEHAGGPRFLVDGEAFSPQVERIGKGTYKVTLDDETFTFSVENGIVQEGTQALDLEVRRAKPVLQRAGGAGRRADGRIKPPMPGTIVELKVGEGAEVQEGQVVCVLEAMKMQNDIKSPFAGTVGKIHVQTGQNVESTTVLLEITPPAP